MDISIFNTIFFDPGSEGGAVGNNKMFSLNLICASIGTGLTELSFLGFLKIIFFILFLLLHIGFLYFEYLDINSKKNSDSHHYMQSNLLDHIKKAAAYFLSGAGGASSYITITNEYQRKQTENLIKENLAKSKEELKKVENEQVSNNMHHKLHIDRIDRTHKNLTDIKKEKSELMRLIEENKAKHKTGSALISTADLRKAESRVQLLDLAEKRVDIELNQDITCGVKFATEIKKQTEEKNLLNLINEDVHKSTIFDFDALWTRFETLDGLSKLVCTMIFSNYLILWCTFGIIINMYGNYLLDRFKLEEKLPKIAFLIKYRQKVTKYYIYSNFLIIILTCLTNMLLGVSILSISI